MKREDGCTQGRRRKRKTRRKKRARNWEDWGERGWGDKCVDEERGSKRCELEAGKP